MRKVPIYKGSELFTNSLTIFYKLWYFNIYLYNYRKLVS